MSGSAAEVAKRLKEAAVKKNATKPKQKQNLMYGAAAVAGVAVVAYFASGFLPVDPVWDEGVRVLSDRDFKSATSEKLTMTMFYAPWCGHCKALKPVWAQLAAEDTSVQWAKADCTAEASGSCNKFGVKGYPTLYMIHGSESAPYEGGRDAESLKAAAQDGIAAANKKAEEAKATAKAEEEALRLAEANSKVNFISDEDWASPNYATKAHLVKFYAPWCGHCKKLAPVWDELALDVDVLAKVSVDKADCTGKAKKMCADFKVKGFPDFYLIEGDEREKFEGSGRELKDFKEFAVSGVKAAKAKRIKAKKAAKAEKEAQDKADAASPVTFLSDADFKSPVFKKQLNLVKFYAPWCGHCKRLTPTWEELATDSDLTDVVVVSKADCTGKAKGACRDHEVSGYPVIKLIQGADSVIFDGPRDLEAIKAFSLAGGVEQAKAHEEKRKVQAAIQKEEETKKREADEANSPVTYLKDDTWESAIAAKPHFIKFYAPWCGHCKSLAPIWEELAQATSNGVVIAKADCDGRAKAFCAKYEVKGFPTLKLLNGAEVRDYDGGRTLEELSAWVEDQAF